MSVVSTEPAFDHRWLDLLVSGLESDSRNDTVLEDVYLERRLEIRLHARSGARWIEECRSNGAAVRRRTAGRLELEATTGITPRAVSRLLGDRPQTRGLLLARPLPQPELDFPRGWRDRADELAASTKAPNITVRLLLRRSAVVRSEGWQEIDTPVLIRLESIAPRSATLLSTWDHPSLEGWAKNLRYTAPRRTWRPKSGDTLDVVFCDGTAGVLLHEVVGHLLESDILTRHGSPLTDSGKAEVAPRTLNVIDDPTRFDLPGAFTCDDEGVEARPITLVEEGQIKGTLCDRSGAFVLGAEPGRGRRSTWSSAPVARLSNLIAAPGVEEPSQLEADVRTGLSIDRLAGAAVDPASGRVVVRVERGWELRHGRRRRALGPCELTGTVLEILAGIDPSLGSDQSPDWRLGWCVKAGLPLPTGSSAPTMLVHSLEVM